MAVVTATAAALLGTVLAPSGMATPAAQGAGPALATSPAPTPEDTASKQAKDSGKAVEVLARRTETSQLFADPSGSFTEEQYVLPRWTRKDHRLVPIDTNLAPGPDGRISPKATTTGVSFSSGGSGPAVTIERDGRKLSLTWPAPLPAPETEGDTATYREVLPGTDLQLRAGNMGFGQLLVVKTPEAAANPALKSIRFSMAAEDLTVSADPDGNVTALDPAGQEVFTAPTPRMWDSSTAATGLARAFADASSEPPNDAFEPGYGSKEAPIDITVDNSALTLQPDQSLLTADDTAYPVFIDPTFSAPGKREAWAIAYKKTPGTSYYNGAGWHNSDGSVGTNLARVGYENVTDGLARSFFQMDSNNLWNTRKNIKTSTFRIDNTWSWSCEHRRVELWLTGTISPSTNWTNTNNSTMWARSLSHVANDETLGYGPGCPAGTLAFDATSAAKDAAAKKWNNITLGLRATNEGDVYSWKKFDAGTAQLTTTYNTYPNAVTSAWTSPDTNTDACLTGQGYLATTVGFADLTLAGTVSDPDGGTVKARFTLWPTGYGGAANEVNKTVDVPSGKTAKLLIPRLDLKKLLTDNGITGTGTFSWHARAEDGELAGTWSPVCQFNYDSARPSFPPSVSSEMFPDGSEGWPDPTGMARSEGTFQLTNKDTAPIAAFEYWTDWDPTVRKITFGPAGGHITTLKLTPPSVGRHALTVRAADAGGNLSDTTRYWFYANGPGTPDKPGDLNGDSLADFYGVRSDGELWFYAGNGTGIMAPASVASNQDFTGADITRRGDWTLDGYEDLIALNPTDSGKKTLTIHPNNGFGHACTNRGEEADSVSKSCQYDKITLDVYNPANNHWANASQILAIGDVDGPLDTNSDGTIDVPAHPDLLVKEGGLLWLYYGSEDNFLDSNKEPKLVGTAGWGSFNLAAPGDHDGDGHADLIARNTTNGELRLYSGGPEGNTLGSGAHHTIIGTSWTPTHRPLLTAVPDANNDGTPDMWATGDDDKLHFYPNSLGSGTIVGSGGWTAFQDLS